MRSKRGTMLSSTQVRFSATSRPSVACTASTAKGGPALFAVVMIGSRAVSGYRGTWASRLDTRTMASSIDVPTSISKVTVAEPVVDSLVSRSRPTTLLSTSSCSRRISRSISEGLAPGHTVVTVRVGTLMSGVS